MLEPAAWSMLGTVSLATFFITHKDYVSNGVLGLIALCLSAFATMYHLTYFVMQPSNIRQAVSREKSFWFILAVYYLQIALFAEAVCGSGIGFAIVGSLFFIFISLLVLDEKKTFFGK